mmetsp:Transcript_37670/g.150228  ORF Transcript_37670/g.150228 Transcript_37670/m.150228 type:complete len:297 (-) Transcript_37670:1224-2114(-)
MAEGSDDVHDLTVSASTPFNPEIEIQVDLASVKCLDSQVGGHRGIFLSSKDGKVLKRCIAEEINFYRYLAENGISETFFPASPGTMVLSMKIDDEVITNETYLVMEDLTKAFIHPSVLDVKVGTVPWGWPITEEKLQKQIKKREATTTGKLGFRITGMKMWMPNQEKYDILDRSFGHHLAPEDVPPAITRFSENAKVDVLKSFLEQLTKFEAWEKSYGTKNLGFHGASLLFIYEGEPSVADPAPPRLCLIDFPHTEYLKSGVTPKLEAWKEDDHDGMLFGISNLANIFQGVARARS